VCLSGCCIRFHIYVASVLSRYCVCLQWFSSVFHIFLQVFQSMFQVFQLSSTYVASIMSGCLKSRSGVAHLVMRVRSGGDTSCSRTRSGGLDGVWAVRAHVGTWNPGAGGAVHFFASVGVECGCERGKLQHGCLDAGLGLDVRAHVVILDNTTCVQLSSARTNFVQTVEGMYKSKGVFSFSLKFFYSVTSDVWTYV
jgi:hypothetical protein